MEALQRWFLSLLRMDGLPKCVQHIQLAQEMAGWGSARSRPPYDELEFSCRAPLEVGNCAKALGFVEDVPRCPPPLRAEPEFA